MKLLCTGDLHIGRRSTCVPTALGDDCSCASGWMRVVEVAIDEGVNAVLLSGDLVNDNSRFFEVYGPLERGLRQLAEANIHTFTVAGNHDHAVLPELIKSLGGGNLHLLGADGKWETYDFASGGENLNIIGWSFPTAHVSSNPLARLPVLADGAPTVGIVHCNVDTPGSVYAPVPMADLRSRAGVCMWLLGHIHVPNNYDGTPLVLNPGSPQAMDPGETGKHGPWIVDIRGGQVASVQQRPISTVMYRSIVVDVTGVAIDDMRGHVLDDVRRQVCDDTGDCSNLELTSCRVTVTGRTKHQAELRSLLGELKGFSEGGLYVEHVAFDLTPDLNLASLAAGKDARALAARILMSIESGNEQADYPALLQQTQDRLKQVHQAKAYAAIRPEATGCQEDDPPDRDAAVQMLRAQCATLLGRLGEGREEQ